MPYRPINATAVAAGATASALLAEQLRDNDLYLDNAAQAVYTGSNPALGVGDRGHRHTAAGSYTHEFDYTDRIAIVPSVNDRLDFYFQDDAIGPATYAATLVEDGGGPRDLPALASYLQGRMRAAAGGTTNLSVTYDNIEDSATRGLFRIRHTGASGTRILKLLFGTGANGPDFTNRSIAPTIGFAQRDLIGAYGYAGSGGFHHGYLQDSIVLRDGGEIGTAGIKDLNVTGAKIAAKVIQTAAIAAAAVAAGNVASHMGSAGSADKQDTGRKHGPMIYDSLNGPAINIAAGGNQNFLFTLGHSGTPCCSVTSRSPGCLQRDLYMTAPVSAGGMSWNVVVYNLTAAQQTVILAAM